MGLESRLVSSDAPASALYRVARSVSPYRMLTVVEAHLDELVSADKRFAEVRADMRSMQRRGVGAEGASMRPPMISMMSAPAEVRNRVNIWRAIDLSYKNGPDLGRSTPYRP